MEATSGLTGVKGWLLVFFILGALNVVMIIAVMAGEYGVLTEAPQFAPLVYFETAVNGILVFWTTYILVKLFSRRAAFVTLVKIYLITLPIFSLIQLFGTRYFFVTSMNLNVSFAEMFNASVLGSLCAQVAVSALWYAYFCKSQRVKNTYGV